MADSSVPGLYLVIYPSGKKSWALRFRRPADRRTSKLVLGSVSTVADDRRDPDPVVGGHLTLAGARRLAALLKHEIATGRDVAAEAQAKKRSVALLAENTFSVAAADFITQHAKKKTRRWQEQAKLLGLREVDGKLELIERGLAARWQDKPLGEIDADLAFRLIEEVRHKGVMGLKRNNDEPSEPRARAMHSALSKMFNWALEKRRVGQNPLDALKRPSAPKARDRVLDDREITKLWRATGQVSKPFDAAVKLLLLTGCRLNEVAQMEVGELSDDLSMWTIPSERTKNGRVHQVPLSLLARAIIAKTERLDGCKFVFSTTGTTPISGWSKTKARLDARMEGVASWRIHDIRRGVATGMAELGIAPHVIELVLNHVSGARGGVAGIYNRAVQMAERRAALEAWAKHIEGLVGHVSSAG
nr:tyrosine-type recombinase/integrase [Bradyrhizobium sp. AUGA SZCCT0283]